MNPKLNCILLIDDDEPTNFLSNMLIEDADCTRHIRIVDSGEKALNYLQYALRSEEPGNESILPDLIFLDINMPRMDGWEFLDEYRKLKCDQLAKTVIILLTTSFNPDDKLRAERITEVAGFENKPLTTDMIQQVINTNLKAGKNYGLK